MVSPNKPMQPAVRKLAIQMHDSVATNEVTRDPRINVVDESPRSRQTLAFGAIPAYRRYELRQARYLDMVEPAQRLAAKRSNLNILDIGCGQGCAFQMLGAAGIKGHWTGLEIDPIRIRECQDLGYQQLITDVDLESESIPGKPASFDLIIASHILEHLTNAEENVQHWYELLAPGGLLLIGVPMHLPPIARFSTAKYQRVGRRPYGHCHFYSMQKLRQILAPYPVSDVRGFRILSARKWLPIEDYRWFMRLSMWAGKRWPGLTQEVNAEIWKPEETA